MLTTNFIQSGLQRGLPKFRRHSRFQWQAFSSALSAKETSKAFETALCDLESEKLYGTTPNLYELDQLANMLRKGRLNLAPKYQRGYVWKDDRASRLVVTALCNRIIPGIVFHEREKGVFDVVDGKQRLTTLLSWYLCGEDPPLFEKICQQHESRSMCTELRKLDENYESLAGLQYIHLSPERKKAMAGFTIPCTIIPFQTPKEEVFSAYEDINSGGENLSSQQLRRAVYYGPYIDMLDELAGNTDFQHIRDPKAMHKKTYTVCGKDSDRELILRAFAFQRSASSYRRPIKTFLNSELLHYETLRSRDQKQCLKQLERLAKEFIWIMKVWRNVMDDGAFRVWQNGSWSPGINKALWDVQYSVLAEIRQVYSAEPPYTRCKDRIKGAVKEMLSSGALDLSGTLTFAKFTERRDMLRRKLFDILQSDDGARRRSFDNPGLLREKLFVQQGGICPICNTTIDRSRIQDTSYVHIDHVHPFSKGGSSTNANAALTHAACNLSKGASDLQQVAA